ncbi:Ubiquitin domain-containing protein DSK2b [Striga hermonthica]|uniref:Ubiquitin domain-containing protein DSK2b n=1 Tax=Striga hermonthica TaxID=68872 RepID=A0A9N7RMV0_STRHE|nr:Ubiquitin domain-containing protein DSK2b [Striga hermonthica]
MGGCDVADGGEDSSIVAGGGEATVNIQCLNGSKFVVQMNLNAVVEAFKSIIAQHCEIPARQQRLIYRGRILRDDRTLHSYGLEADHTVHLVQGLSSDESSHGAATSHAGVQSTNSTDDVASVGGWPIGGFGLGSSFLSTLGLNGSGNGSGLFGVSVPDMDTQNPNMIRGILDAYQILSSAISPETMHNLIMNGSRVREFMDRNPELVHIVNDPETIRKTMAAAQNHEIMHKTDRELSNIESSQWVYENVQRPMLNSFIMAGDIMSDLVAQVGGHGGVRTASLVSPGSETTTNSASPNTSPLPNPWASGVLSDPIGNARPISPGGLAGSGVPDLEHLLGSISEITTIDQLMEMENISQRMHSLLSSPQLMNQILGNNPSLRSMLDSSPQLRHTMQNPEFIRRVTSPEVMQVTAIFFISICTESLDLRNRFCPSACEVPFMCGYSMVLRMFNPCAVELVAPSEEIYSTQLYELQELGFADTQENIQALIATAGNVQAAVEHLLANRGR